MLHLTDSTTYRPTTHYSRERIHKELQNILIGLKEYLPKHLYWFLTKIPHHLRTPQFYGIPNIHKPYTTLPPMRPFVSQSSSMLRPNAQFIHHVPQPLTSFYPDYIKNSTSLTLCLQDLAVPDDAILVTVDVSSLYPFIPL